MWELEVYEVDELLRKTKMIMHLERLSEKTAKMMQNKILDNRHLEMDNIRIGVTIKRS